ncbi:large ribosomal subunit protein bL35 [Acidaminobacterium chupaoyuni]
MPKIKTHTGTKKRVSVTKNGKVKFFSTNRRHDIKGCKSAKRKRHLRKANFAGATTAATLKRLVPYK